MTNLQGSRWVVSALISFALTIALSFGEFGVGLPDATVKGQTPPAPAAAPAKGKTVGKGSRVKGRNAKNAAPQPKALPNAADPFAKAAPEAAKVPLSETYHYRLKIETSDDATLVASYYPAKLDTSTPVLLLVHEKGRSSKDFETAIPDLKGKGAAQHFQSLGYAVVSLDLRGHGFNKRGSLTKQDWLDMVYDLQTVYDFLLDRHNRGELNLAKLGVLALGEGANLSAAWADLPNGAVSSEGRTTDLAALALISPTLDWEGTSFDAQMKELGPRIPILLAAGERDNLSKAALQKVRDGLEKTRQNVVKFFPTLLHGYKLLQLEPGATGVIDSFFDATIKSKAIDWEPRYNLTPAPYSDIELIRHAKVIEKPKAAEKADAKAKPDDAPKDKD